MNDASALLRRQRARLKDAQAVLDTLDVLRCWRDYGTPRLVGSVAYELVVAPDIDVEIIGKPNVRAGFILAGRWADDPALRKVLFINDLDGRDGGLGWELTYMRGATPWKIQMWLIPPETATPLAADLVEPLKAALAIEHRVAILRIKEYVLQHAEPHQSIDIYRAVLDHDIRTPAAYSDWAASNTSTSLIRWRPTSRAADPP